MGLEKLVRIAKGETEEKGAVSFKLPMYLKNQLVEFTTKNEITVNSFLVALIDDTLNGELKDKSNLEAISKLEDLIKERENIRNAIEGHGKYLTLENGQEMNLYEKLDDIDYMIKVLKGII